MTETLIEKLEAEKVDYESTMMDSDRAYNQAIDDCIAVVRQHEAAQPQDVQDLLRDMRRQVEYSDKATMPIPLYERMKAAIAAMEGVEAKEPDITGIPHSSATGPKVDNLAPSTTHTLIGKLEVIDLALDKSIDVNDEYMDEAKSLLTKLIKEVQQREIPVCNKCDAEMLRVKMCEHIAEGEEGWNTPENRNICPSTMAVAELRDKYEALLKRELVGWQSIKSAPENADVLVKTESGYVFPAKYDPTCSLNDKEEVCGGWLATLESFCPPCWSDDQCWESNSDGIMSEQPIAWKPLNSIEVREVL